MPKNDPPVHTTGGRFSFSKLNCHIWFTVDRMEDKLQRVRIVCQRVRIGLFADGQRIAVLRHIVPAGRLIERRKEGLGVGIFRLSDRHRIAVISLPEGQILLAGGTAPVSFREMYVRELPPTPRFELSPEEAAEGFEVLFDGTSMHKWTGNTTNYVPLDGTIYVTAQYGGSGNLYTKKEYADFILRFEFQFVQEGVNNGIGIRTPMGVDAAYHGMEIQILDHDAPIYKNLREYQQHGSVYGIIPAKRVIFPSLGTWNVEEIRAVGDRITVTVNGEVILDGDIREACQGHNVAPDGGKKNPYTVDHRNHPGLFNASGHIGLLGHGPGIKFRNIRIKELPCSKVRDLPAPVKTK